MQPCGGGNSFRRDSWLMSEPFHHTTSVSLFATSRPQAYCRRCCFETDNKRLPPPQAYLALPHVVRAAQLSRGCFRCEQYCLASVQLRLLISTPVGHHGGWFADGDRDRSWLWASRGFFQQWLASAAATAARSRSWLNQSTFSGP